MSDTTTSIDAAEQIDVARVCIRAASRRVAVFGEMRAADRALLAWREGGVEPCKVDVEVTFVDGYVFCGCYEYARRGKRPSVAGFLRRAFDAAPSRLSRYALDP